MKNLILLTILLFLGIRATSQTANVVFFSMNGERFSVVMNGMLQNDQPETNIKITDLSAPNFKVKIIFSDKRIPELSKTIYLNPGNETTYAIKFTRKKGYTLRMMNSFPLQDKYVLIPEQRIIGFSPQGVNSQNGSSTSIINTTTINNNVTISTSGAGNNVNVVNQNEDAGAQQAGSATGVSSGGRMSNPDPYILDGYTGPYGCPRPMSPSDFEQAKESIRSKSFEDSKLTLARQIISSNCMLSAQVKEIMLLFSFEDTRLEFAKYAYTYTLDLRNYYKLNDAFTFESSISELDSFIRNTRH
jgi:hypothetical protein